MNKYRLSVVANLSGHIVKKFEWCVKAQDEYALRDVVNARDIECFDKSGDRGCILTKDVEELIHMAQVGNECNMDEYLDRIEDFVMSHPDSAIWYELIEHDV